MKGICHIWSRGRHFSPSLPGDRYLKLSSQKRSPGRNLGEHRLVRRSGTASRGTALLGFYLRRTEALTIFVGKSIRLGTSECTPLVFAFSGGSWQFTSSCAYTMASTLKLEIGNNRIHFSLKSCFVESFFSGVCESEWRLSWSRNICLLREHTTHALFQFMKAIEARIIHWTFSGHHPYVGRCIMYWDKEA